MRIALITRRFDPAGGGTERDLTITARLLSRAGHSHHDLRRGTARFLRRTDLAASCGASSRSCSRVAVVRARGRCGSARRWRGPGAEFRASRRCGHPAIRRWCAFELRTRCAPMANRAGAARNAPQPLPSRANDGRACGLQFATLAARDRGVRSRARRPDAHVHARLVTRGHALQWSRDRSLHARPQYGRARRDSAGTRRSPTRSRP